MTRREESRATSTSRSLSRVEYSVDTNRMGSVLHGKAPVKDEFSTIAKEIMHIHRKFRSGAAAPGRLVKEWRMYAVDYEALHPGNTTDTQHQGDANKEGFQAVLNENITKLVSFFQENEKWALGRFPSIEKQVLELEPLLQEAMIKHNSKQNERSESFTLIGKYLSIKKRVFSFQSELDLLLEFLELNRTAVKSILLQKRQHHLETISIREREIRRMPDLRLLEDLKGTVLSGLKKESELLLQRMQHYWPLFQNVFKGKICLTSGCFDLFHRGHRNFLEFIRGIGSERVVAIVPDDETYLQIKRKPPIDDFVARKTNLEEFVDEVYQWNIHREDYAGSFMSFFEKNGIAPSQCFMFCSEEYEGIVKDLFEPLSLPYLTLPRMERCSSTWIRSAYHH